MSDAVRTVEVLDESGPLADAALGVIADMFAPADRQPLEELRSEIAERRLGVLARPGFHVLTALAEGSDDPAGTIVGRYLEDVNAGIITYLAVRRQHRGQRIARVLRPHLIEVFRADARRAGFADLAWVLGEVRMESPWLRRLIRTRGAVPFDIEYYHPGMSLHGSERYVLYRQPVGDHARELPASLVRRTLFAIYRHAYRVRYPLTRDIFRAMLDQLEGRESVGVHPAFRALYGGQADASRQTEPARRPSARCNTHAGSRPPLPE